MMEINPLVSWVSDDPQQILVGSYLSDSDTLIEAQNNTMERVIRMIPRLKKSSKVLVIFDGCLYVPLYLASVFQSKIFLMCESESKAMAVQKDLEGYEFSSCISTVSGDYNALPFDFDYFDFVWSVNSLVRKENILNILREIKNVLTPQGRFLLLEEVLTSNNGGHKDSLLYNAEDILNYGTTADLEQVSNIRLDKESKMHYAKLEDSDMFKDTRHKNKIDQLKDNAIQDVTCWHFIQFQKRNS